VAVTFTCNNGYTYAGQSVYVVGNQSELSNWSISSASASQKLDPNAYPSWSGTINLPANTNIEWKCVKREEINVNAGQEWQSGGNNTLTTPSSGSASTSGSF
jgi:alpha-amylase